MGTVAQFPKPQACHVCEHKYAGAVCPICKTERPAYAALKAITARERTGVQAITKELPACRYYERALCDCGLRGLCIPAA